MPKAMQIKLLTIFQQWVAEQVVHLSQIQVQLVQVIVLHLVLDTQWMLVEQL
jgi:hypothetical protein